MIFNNNKKYVHFILLNDLRIQCCYDSEAFHHDSVELVVEQFVREIHELFDFVDDRPIPKECDNVDVHRDNGESLLDQFALLIRDCQSKGLQCFQVEKLPKTPMQL